MIVTTKRKPVDVPREAELLLPWLVTGRLGAADTRRLRAALARDPDLARDYAAVQEEYNEAILLHDALGGPSPRAMRNLFAAIESEPPREHARREGAAHGFAALSPRLIAFAAAAALITLVAQAAVFGARIL